MARSIEEFAAERARPKKWADRLSPEVRTAVIDAHHAGFGKHMIANWLQQEWGVEDATASKVLSLTLEVDRANAQA